MDIQGWEEFEREHRIPVVFDAAAALMSIDAAGHQPLCVSLHATKVLGIGEGGAILSTDKAFIEQITGMSGFGFMGASRVSAIRGGNYRISEYTAAVGLAALAKSEDKIARLKTVALTYADELRNSQIRLQDGVGENWVTMTLNVRLPADSVTDTLQRLDESGIQWRRWWGLGCQSHPAFASLRSLNLPVTNDLAPRVIGVPCHSMLGADDIEFVSRCLLTT
jgi:dTDP-4-amino-4,6-dideoxygalactose transaminase